MPPAVPVPQPDDGRRRRIRRRAPPGKRGGGIREARTMNIRSSIAAALLLASVVRIRACDRHATLAAKGTASQAASAVEANHLSPNALYPIEARYESPGPFGSTEISYTLPSGLVYKIYRPL